MGKQNDFTRNVSSQCFQRVRNQRTKKHGKQTTWKNKETLQKKKKKRLLSVFDILTYQTA